MPLILPFHGHTPTIAGDVFIAPNATIIGNVHIGPGATVWYGAVIRGDTGSIVIGARTNVQDNAVIHVNDRHDTIIGAEVTIGHAVVLEGCRIGDGALLGMNATILDGARIGAGVLVAAGSVVREYAEIPAHTLVAGVPAQVKMALTPEMRARVARAPQHYVDAGEYHKRAIDRAGSDRDRPDAARSHD